MYNPLKLCSVSFINRMLRFLKVNIHSANMFFWAKKEWSVARDLSTLPIKSTTTSDYHLAPFKDRLCKELHIHLSSKRQDKIEDECIQNNCNISPAAIISPKVISLSAAAPRSQGNITTLGVPTKCSRLIDIDRFGKLFSLLIIKTKGFQYLMTCIIFF